MGGEWIRGPNIGVASVVFVHGILSSGETCWKHKNGIYWPDLLKNEPRCTSLGIYVYSYQTGFSNGSYSLGDVVDDLKEHIITLDKVIDSNKIIFVCHSMGGIVVRKFLVERVQDLLDRNIEVGLFLVASPSLGSKYANWLEPIAKFAGHAQAKALKFSQDNPWLNDLDKTFQNLKESGRLKVQGKELLEDKFIVLNKLFRKQVVDSISGSRYFGESYKVPESDHFSIAKPQDKTAVQHRLLLAFINEISPENFQDNQTHHAAIDPIPSNDNKGVGDLNETKPQGQLLQNWQNKLIKNINEQLQRPDLSQVVEIFIQKLTQGNSNLKTDPISIAKYLVFGEEDRHLHVAQFLTALQESDINPSLDSPEKVLLSYLLQTLVRKFCDENDKGVSRIHLDKPQSVELVSASRNSAVHIPNYSENTREYQNGQKDSKFQNVGHFIPETGEFDEQAICQNIAKDLLITLGISANSDSTDCLTALSGYLSAYKDEPGNAPLQTIYLKQNAGHNPLQIKTVADIFQERLGKLLWLYIYGGKNSKDWLHTTEDELEGLVQRYEQQNKSELYSAQQKPTGESLMKPEINIENTDGNVNVNIVSGTQKGSQVGQGNIQLSNADIEQLLQLLEQLRHNAEQDDGLGKKEYADINQATEDIKTEIQKNQSADKNVLTKAKEVLEGFNDVASIAGSVEKITQLLLPFLG